MGFEIGNICNGKVTSITKYGAFVSLEEGKSGMVHISEISHTYVNDINEHLQVGQQVKVKVIGIDENGEAVGMVAQNVIGTASDHHAGLILFGNRADDRALDGKQTVVERKRRGGVRRMKEVGRLAEN